MAWDVTESRNIPVLGWADVGIIAVGQNAIGVVAIADFNATGVIAIRGWKSRSALPLQ